MLPTVHPSLILRIGVLLYVETLYGLVSKRACMNWPHTITRWLTFRIRVRRVGGKDVPPKGRLLRESLVGRQLQSIISCLLSCIKLGVASGLVTLCLF